MSRTAPPGRGSPRWVWVLLPANAGVQGFSTMVPLYILLLGGGVVDVALYATLYNFVLIPSSIFWGRMTDRLGVRRPFFVFSYAGTAAVFAMMYFVPNLLVLGLLYGSLGFLISANSAATNLLVMETSEKRSWVSSYARISLFANLGSIIGVVVGFFWSSTLPLGAFLLFCAAGTAFSTMMAFSLISEPSITLETMQLTRHPEGLLYRFYHGIAGVMHQLVIHPPSPKEAMRIVRAARAGAMTGKALLFVSTFVFTTSSALLNTPFTPFLHDYGVLDNEIFAVSMVNIVVSTGAYRWIGEFTKKLGEMRVGSHAIIGRTVIYILFAFSALLLRNTSLFVISTVLYGLVGVAYALWNSSTSVMLFSSLGPAGQGNLLGGYSALSSLGTVTGSLFSGYISFYGGYSITFTIAAIMMLFSFFILEASIKSFGYAR